MEGFYRLQRTRLNVLMEDGKPVGGAWNFDKENRLGPPKNYSWPEPLYFPIDDIDDSVASEMGHTPSGCWSTTREGALAQLERFFSALRQLWALRRCHGSFELVYAPLTFKPVPK